MQNFISILKSIFKFTFFHLIIYTIIFVLVPYTYYKFETKKFENRTKEIIKNNQVDSFDFVIANTDFENLNENNYRPKTEKLNNKEFYDQFYLDYECITDVKYIENECPTNKEEGFFNSNDFGNNFMDAFDTVTFLTKFCNECKFYYEKGKNGYDFSLSIFYNNKPINFIERKYNKSLSLNILVDESVTEKNKTEYFFYDNQYVYKEFNLKNDEEELYISSGDKEDLYSFDNFEKNDFFNENYELDILFSFIELWFTKDIVLYNKKFKFDIKKMLADREYNYSYIRNKTDIIYTDFKEIYNIKPLFFENYNKAQENKIATQDILDQLSLLSIVDDELIDNFIFGVIIYFILILLLKMIITIFTNISKKKNLKMSILLIAPAFLSTALLINIIISIFKDWE